MSGPGSASDSRIGLARAVTVAIMAMVLYLACLVCAYGFISLATGIDVIAGPDVGPLLGPVLAAAASLIVFFAVVFEMRAFRGRAAPPWSRAIIAGLAVYLLVPLAGAVVVTVDRVDAAAGLLFFAARATGPFVPAAAILAFLVLAFVPPVFALGGRGRP